MFLKPSAHQPTASRYNKKLYFTRRPAPVSTVQPYTIQDSIKPREGLLSQKGQLVATKSDHFENETRTRAEIEPQIGTWPPPAPWASESKHPANSPRIDSQDDRSIEMACQSKPGHCRSSLIRTN